MKKHANISIFVPHLGCPNMCSFCNQHYIACTQNSPDESDIENAVLLAKSSKNYIAENTELAFFGGSFTAIDRQYMLKLLKAAHRFVKSGEVNGIRISTRPDAINSEVLDILKQHGVTAIELGAQSMDNEVLRLNRRGHTASDIVNSAKLIKEKGFSLGLQMMTGLLGDTNEKAIKTAEEIIKLSPATVRIYPTIVLEDTYLAELYRCGQYAPQTLQNAVELAGRLLNMFALVNIPVIRTGLHTIDQTKFVAGPWHPAFKELCESEVYLKIAKSSLKEKGDYIIYVKKGSISKMIGQKRKNIETLKNLGYNCKVAEDDQLEEFQIKLEKAGGCE